MKEGTCSRLREEDMVLCPRRLKCMDEGIVYVTEEGNQGCLEEDRLLLACIEQEQPGGNGIIRIPVQDVTKKTKGRFFLGTIYGTTCEIRTEQLGETAGELLMEVAGRYPWLWIGEHACLDDRNRNQWKELQKMVETMRIYCRM